MSRRVYLGRLPPTATKTEIEDHFKGFPIVDIRPMGNFGFVEFESSRDAEQVIREFSGKEFLGESLIVEEARDARRRDVYDPGSRPPPRSSPARRGTRVHVLGVPSSTSWQDLKDFGRLGSNTVTFADIDRNNPGTGILEFPTLSEAEDAMKRLAGVDINGTPVEVKLAPEPSGGGYDDRRGGNDDRRGGYDDRRGGHDDRRGGHDDRRGGYDDRRGGYDDRRGGYDDRRAQPSRDYSYERPRHDDRAGGDRFGGGGGRDRSPPPRREYDSGSRRDYERDRSPPRRRDDDRSGRTGDRDRNGSARE
ncbi:MAG: hypothetical protein TREMPRED_005978 [Tremellales sp. Tagirdzhanova-0007]|nr:MAG: hypothetical protein TREMPRED_005978 [Tremellales sp. Tagirdzhanova-0007]